MEVGRGGGCCQVTVPTLGVAHRIRREENIGQMNVLEFRQRGWLGEKVTRQRALIIADEIVGAAGQSLPMIEWRSSRPEQLLRRQNLLHAGPANVHAEWCPDVV